MKYRPHLPPLPSPLFLNRVADSKLLQDVSIEGNKLTGVNVFPQTLGSFWTFYGFRSTQNTVRDRYTLINTIFQRAKCSRRFRLMKIGNNNNNVFMFLTCPVIVNHYIKIPDAANYVNNSVSLFYSRMCLFKC